MEATLIERFEEGPNRWIIVLDQTLFYPRSGGQSADHGLLTADGWTGRVDQVFHQEGRILHHIEGTAPPPVGTRLTGSLDWERRYLHMRLHSGGHIVDFALYLLGLSPTPLFPVKGDHGKKPVITYKGVVDREFRQELEEKANLLVAQDLPFACRFASYEELQREAIYLQPGLPTDRPLHILSLAGVGSVADGGTQVRTTGEVGPIAILPTKYKDGHTLIAYRLTCAP